MIDQVLALKKAGQWIQEHGYGELRLRLQVALGLPDGWLMVYETLLAEPQNPLAAQATIRLRDSLLILFVDGRHANAHLETADGITCEFSQFVEQGQASLQEAVSFVEQTDQALRDTRLPSEEEAIQALRDDLKVTPADGFMVLKSEPVLDRAEYEKGDLEIARWRIAYRYKGRIKKCYVGYRLKQSIIQVGEYKPIASRAIHPPAKRRPRRSARRYGRLDFDYYRQNFKLRVNLGIHRLADSLTEDRERLLQMRGELMFWYCKHHCLAYLKRLGYQNIDLNLAKLDQMSDRATVFDPHVNTPVMGDTSVTVSKAVSIEDTLQILSEFSTVDLISAYPQMHFTYSLERMLNWAEDPSIVFHEFGHALGFLFYVPRLSGKWWFNDISRPIEEGFCDYLAAVLMDDLKPGFAAEVGIGGILTQATGKNMRCLPRFVGGSQVSDCDDDIYRQGSQWANYLWDARQQLGGDLEADAIITCAHFHPYLPPFSSGRSAVDAHIYSLQMTMQRWGKRFSDQEWQDLAARHLL